MSSAARPLLPLFYSKRSGRGAINERTLIFILLGSSLVTVWLIFRNLPTIKETEIKRIFIPKVNEPKIAQIDNPPHLANPDIEDDNKHNDDSDRRSVHDPVNEMRKNHVRNVNFRSKLELLSNF